MEETTSLVQEHLKALQLGLILALIALFTASRFHFFRLPLRNTGQILFKDVLGAFVLYLLISIVIIPLAALGIFSYMKGEMITGKSLSTLEESWINIALIFSTAMALSAYLAWIKPWVIFGEKGFTGRTRNFLIGAGTWLIAFPVTIVVGQVLSIATLLFFPGPIKEQVAVMYVRLSQSSPLLFWILIFTIIVLVPLLEEILFRGFLQTYLRQYLRPAAAIALTSAIFALFHFSSSQGVSNFEIIGSLFVLSCFLGFLFERQGSLWAPVGLHAMFNFVSISLLLFEG